MTDTHAAPSRRERLSLAALALALVWLALVLPNSAPRFAPPAFARLPLELPLLMLALTVVRPRAIRMAAALVLVLLLVATLADIATYEAFARPFNPVLDAHLVRAAWELLAGTIGTGSAAAVVLLVSLALWCLRRLHRLATRRPGPVRAVALMALGLGIALNLTGRTLHERTPVATHEASQRLWTQGRTAVHSLTDLRDFRREAADDPAAIIPDDRLFAALRGKDVLIVFVESYGRGALQGACCATRTAEALQRFQSRLDAAGFSAASAWLTAVTVGGQSWLNHATLLAGLEVGNQQRYNSLVITGRATLIRDFRRAGWRTVAVMPAITRAWPEGEAFGYDRIYDAETLDYRGRPFNWVTMPDQFTLEAFRRAELAPEGRPPVMAEIAMISSHAPWTPIPPVIGWDGIGDGTVFNRWSDSGDPPSVVWRDNARIREQYSLSIEYVLDTLSGFIETHGHDDLVLLVLGDHQPAPLVTGPDATMDVPVHLIARDPAVLRAAGDWNWSEGMVPGEAAPVWPMRDMRARLIDAFTPPPSGSP